MAISYKTPGVYVEEISKLPPSVAQVETAIPVFIGYTEKAEKNGESLFNKTKTVSSLAEFEAWYGREPETTYLTYLDPTDAVNTVVSSLPYFLYDSLRLFYDNGGGRCYILSVGPYKTTGKVDIADLLPALKILEREDEPTIIVCPDAALADNKGLYDFQKQSLALCAKLGDRVIVCDTKPSNETVANETLADRVLEFRNEIGISNLNYGAAYIPYLQSSLPRKIKFRDIALKRGTPTASTDLSLEALTSDPATIQLILDLKNAKKAVDDFKKVISSAAPGILTAPAKTFEDQYKALFDTYTTAATDGAKTTAVKAIYVFTVKVLSELKKLQDALPAKVTTPPTPPSSTQSVAFLLKDDMTSLATNAGVKAVFQTIGAHSNDFGAGTAADQLITEDPTAGDLKNAVDFLGIQPGDYDTLTDPAYNSGDPIGVRNDLARTVIAGAYPTILKLFYSIQSAAAAYEKTFDESLEASMGIFKQIKNTIALRAFILPPSGAIAGIYARVDGARGVWKAPANESINSVLGPVVQITAEEQAGLNVDPVAGKSINAIRTFTGRGNAIVWGARTLAGNDNEWRYISVRRFFNMVEESSKKSTEPFVFETNDANTWVKVQGMIENFLTTLWRQGALQGIKPEHAFYVAVGLGKTMTALDILEGRMIVEIGMAVVRPAEFIILRFSHKMAES
jgi:uncharacterized protein